MAPVGSVDGRTDGKGCSSHPGGTDALDGYYPRPDELASTIISLDGAISEKDGLLRVTQLNAPTQDTLASITIGIGKSLRAGRIRDSCSSVDRVPPGDPRRSNRPLGAGWVGGTRRTSWTGWTGWTDRCPAHRGDYWAARPQLTDLKRPSSSIMRGYFQGYQAGCSPSRQSQSTSQDSYLLQHGRHIRLR